MAIEKVYLDPNAASYTDDEIVGKVNTATVNITRASSVASAARPIEALEVTNAGLAANAVTDAKVAAGAAISADKMADGTTNKAYTTTEQTKLGTVEDNATADQTGTEVRDLVVALADDDREIIISRPTTGQKKIYAVQTHTDGKQEVEQSDTAEI